MWVFWEVSWKENGQAVRKTWESTHLRDGQSQPLESQSDSAWCKQGCMMKGIYASKVFGSQALRKSQSLFPMPSLKVHRVVPVMW